MPEIFAYRQWPLAAIVPPFGTTRGQGSPDERSRRPIHSGSRTAVYIAPKRRFAALQLKIILWIEFHLRPRFFSDTLRRHTIERYVVRQNQRPRCCPVDLKGQPNSGKAVDVTVSVFSGFTFLLSHLVPLLLGKELTGSVDQNSSAPSKLYGRIQLFNRALGHLSAVYCVLFDRTGQYIFTVRCTFFKKMFYAFIPAP